MTNKNNSKIDGKMIPSSTETDYSNRRNVLRSTVGIGASIVGFGIAPSVSAQSVVEESNEDDPIFDEVSEKEIVEEFENNFGKTETSILLNSRNKFRSQVDDEKRGETNQDAFNEFLSFGKNHPKLNKSIEHFESVENERDNIFEPISETVSDKNVEIMGTSTDINQLATTTNAVSVSITTSAQNSVTSIGSLSETFVDVPNREMGEYVFIPLIGSGSAWARLGGIYNHTRTSGSYNVRIRYRRSGNTWGADTSFVIRYRNRSSGTIINREVERPTESTFGEEKDVTVFDQFNFTNGTRYDVSLEVRGSVSGVVKGFSDYALDSLGSPRRFVRINDISVIGD